MKRLHAAMQRHVAAKAAPGIVTGIVHRGQTDVGAYGSFAFDGKLIARDAIFRIASITKTIVAAATMSLIEDATLHLDAPVDEWLPELANRKVLKQIDGPLDETVKARRPITIRDLLTFKLGFGLLFGESGLPIQKAIADRELHLGPPHPARTPAPDEWMRRLGELPLMFQPGEQFLYSAGSDILGVLLARATGKPLEALLFERIFEPLGMRDTAFHCPSTKLHRFTTGYFAMKPGDPVELLDSATDGEWNAPPAFPSGAAGLLSTVEDLLAFGRMLLAQGIYGKRRVLARTSVLAMATDQLDGTENADRYFFKGYFQTHGWGFGCAVVTKRHSPSASPGAFGWDGGWGTSLWVDPAEDLVGVLLTQRAGPPDLSPIYRDFWALVYGGLDG
jgi:CubicO group peptidase (beta-lactamase class C family)